MGCLLNIKVAILHKFFNFLTFSRFIKYDKNAQNIEIKFFLCHFMLGRIHRVLKILKIAMFEVLKQVFNTHSLQKIRPVCVVQINHFVFMRKYINVQCLPIHLTCTFFKLLTFFHKFLFLTKKKRIITQNWNNFLNTLIPSEKNHLKLAYIVPKQKIGKKSYNFQVFSLIFFLSFFLLISWSFFMCVATQLRAR